MKLYKKTVACLLTAAMAISMLTACGGGGTGGGGGGGGGKTPSTLPDPNKIVLPDIGGGGSSGGGGGEGTETKPTKILIVDVNNNSKLVQFYKKYEGSTEYYIETLIERYDRSGSARESGTRIDARKDSNYYLRESTTDSTQQKSNYEHLVCKEDKSWSQYLLLHNSKIALKIFSASSDPDITLGSIIVGTLPTQIWSTTVKVGVTPYYAEVYQQNYSEYTVCFAANGDPVYQFVRDLDTTRFSSIKVYKSIQPGVSKDLCTMPRGFNTSYRLKGSTLYDADGNEFTVVFHSTSDGDYTVTDQNGKEVTKEFGWLNEYFNMYS
mgnify:FL=1